VTELRDAALKRSRSWRLFWEAESLVVSAGADEQLLIDELDRERSARFFAAYEADDFAPLEEADDEWRAFLRRLETAGVLYRRRAFTPPLRVKLAWSVTVDARLEALLAHVLASSLRLKLVSGAGEEADLVVVVRTSEALLEAAERSIPTPHLLVDAAYHHTVSVGPLVWPGATACLQCFAGRIRHGWGDPSPPPEPLAARSHPFLAGLIVLLLERFEREGGLPLLTNRAHVINLATLATKTELVHRLPWCPRCFPERAPHGTGTFSLPWATAAGTT
jgi:bacteriocin biosynthesis cyclodehydratase domain-containing protein